jgi:hypothetical protein
MIRIREGNVESVLYFTDEAALSAFAAENRDLGLFDEQLTDEELAAELENSCGHLSHMEVELMTLFTLLISLYDPLLNEAHSSI